MKVFSSFKWVLGVVLFGVLTGCSSSEFLNSDDPEKIYNEALKLSENDYYLDAKEHLDEIRKRFPQSRFAALAELRAADLEFKQENYAEAAALYSSFVELYPNHAEAAYAQFKKTDSFFKDIPSNIARDQAPAKDAAKSALQLKDRYGTSTYVKEAEDIYKKSRFRLAEKEAYIARFYEKKDQYAAAYKRWFGLTKKFNDIAELKTPEAQKLLSEAEQKLKELKSKLAENEIPSES